MRIVSWNIKKLDEAWRQLADDPSVDVALLQEAKPPPSGVTYEVVPDRAADADWTMPGYGHPFRTAVAQLSNRVVMHPLRTADLGTAGKDVWCVSYRGTLTAVDVETAGEKFTCISAYAPWQNVVSAAVKPWIISDASAHRLVSDISTLISTENGHRIIVAGDWNILHGYGEHGSPYWARRYATVFDRMAALGLRYVGPSSPNGRQAEPWPSELPKESGNVPTFRSSQQTPASATRQLDFVFASDSIADRVTTKAMNGVDEWGVSDHCRVVIDVAPTM